MQIYTRFWLYVVFIGTGKLYTYSFDQQRLLFFGGIYRYR